MNDDYDNFFNDLDELMKPDTFRVRWVRVLRNLPWHARLWWRDRHYRRESRGERRQMERLGRARRRLIKARDNYLHEKKRSEEHV